MIIDWYDRKKQYISSLVPSATHTRSMWALSDELMVEHMCQNTNPSAKEWLFSMSESLSQIEFTRMSVTLWVIWSSRRKVIHADIFQSPWSMHGFVNSYLNDIQFLPRTNGTVQ